MKYQLKNKDITFFPDEAVDSLLRINGIGNTDKYTSIGLEKFNDISEGFLDWCGDEDNIELIKNYSQSKERFGILCDSDYDGYSSASLVYRYLISRHISSDNIVVYFHTSKQHGLSDNEVFEQIKTDHPDVLFIPDAGSNDVSQCRELSEFIGVDVFIFDHHEIEQINPFAFVFNPFFNNTKENPFITMSGCGVTLFVLMLAGYIPNKEDYEITAMSIVSDHMDCRSYVNRWILDRGFNHYPTHELFKNMVDSDMYNNIKELNPIYCDFNIIPRFNAIIRIGEQDEKEMMFKAIAGDHEMFDYTKRDKSVVKETLAERVSRIGKNAQSRQSRLVNKDADNVAQFVDDNDLAHDKVIVLNLSWKGFPEITEVCKGITASRISEKYNRPVIMCKWNEKNQDFEGSIRNNCDYIDDFKKLLEDTGKCEVAGHGNAAGFKCKSEDNLINLVTDINNICSASDYQKTYYVDGVINYNEIDMFTASQIEGFKKYAGAGIDEPVFYIKDVPFDSDKTTIIGKDSNTVKFGDDSVDCIRFHMHGSAMDDIINDWYSGKLNLIGHVGLNYHEGVFKPQIIIQDAEEENGEDEDW